MRLIVNQYGRSVGILESTSDRGVVFRYSADYCRQPDARALSLSLPVREAEFSQSRTLPFFSGLLPDGDLKRRIADYLHLSETSSLRLLEALGGECAGTVSLLVEGYADTSGAVQEAERYDEIREDELERMVLEAERVPLLVPRGGVRLSLAGAQEKLPLRRKDGRWYRPAGGAPSSHILKPASSAFPDITANEFVSMRLASACGLPVPPVELVRMGKPVLVVERYDRVAAPDGTIARLHQEDFCQALGIMPDRKYQADGGPGFAEIAALVRRSCTAPLRDIELLIDIALFNVFLGNCDAHGKNFSLLRQGGHLALAPFYDLVATTIWPDLDTKLSMRFGREYRLDRLRGSDIDGFAGDLAVKPALVRERAERLASIAPVAWKTVDALPGLDGYANLLGRMREAWDMRENRLVRNG